jgi:thymidine phosphorylase
MCVALGGPAGFVTNSSKHLAKATVVKPVHATGFLAEVNVRAVGNAIIELGGGRHQVGEELDLSVGFSEVARIGTLLDGETPLAIIHAASDDDADMAAKLLLDACITQEDAPVVGPVIHEKLTGES